LQTWRNKKKIKNNGAEPGLEPGACHNQNFSGEKREFRNPKRQSYH
jgi:hypothetical protein